MNVGRNLIFINVEKKDMHVKIINFYSVFGNRVLFQTSVLYLNK